jgi:probable phosphoglycerate mutase
MTTIYLTRHAEAEGNVYRRCHGIYDSMLTPKAWEQLPYIAKRFDDVPLSAVYASALYRARHTAKAIADRKGMKVIIRPELHEIDMGDWEDLTWAVLPRRYPKEFAIWNARPWECQVPGGETVMQAGDRVLAELHRIAAQHDGQEIAVVSHGSAIRSILCRVLRLPPEKIGEIGWGDNTCVAKLIFQDGNVHAEYWNDASHLPQELSTFASIGWKDAKSIPSTIQIWFRPYNPENESDRRLFLQFVHEQYKSAYGSDNKLDEVQKLALAADAQAVSPRAVSFGMLEDTPVALVFLNAADQSEPGTGFVGAYCIDAKYRGSGLSKQIIGQSLSVYRELGREWLCAAVAEHNERAKGFYHKFHFEQRGERINECGRHFLMYRRIKVDSLQEEQDLFDLNQIAL